MEQKGTAYFFGRPAGEPNTLPGPISYEKFPLEISFNKTGTPFQDSPWRSIAGYVRKSECRAIGFERSESYFL